MLIFDVLPGDKDRPRGEATHHGQAVLHEPGPVVQCEEQRRSKQTGGKTGQLCPAVGSTHPESGFQQLAGIYLTSPNSVWGVDELLMWWFAKLHMAHLSRWVWVFFLFFFVWVISVQNANTLRSNLCCYKNSALMKLESWKLQLWHIMTWKNWLHEGGHWAPQRGLRVTPVQAIEEGLTIPGCLQSCQ